MELQRGGGRYEHVSYDLDQEKENHAEKYKIVLKELKRSCYMSKLRRFEQYQTFILDVMSLNCPVCGGFVLLPTIRNSTTKDTTLRIVCRCENVDLINMMFP